MAPEQSTLPAPDWRRVLAAVVAVWWVFLTIGIATVTLPAQVVTRFGYSETALGVAALAFGASTVLARLAFSPVLARFSVWRVSALATTVYAVALGLTPIASDLVQVVVLRIAAGSAEGIFYLAAASAITQAVPERARGRALSYLSVGLFAGIAVGPYIGNQLKQVGGIELAWWCAAGLAIVATITVLPRTRHRIAPVDIPAPAGAPPSRRGWPAVSVWAAGIMMLGTIGYGGFQALLPLIGPEVGVQETGYIFAMFAVVSVLVRAGLAGLIDRLDSYRLATWSALLTCVGLCVLGVGVTGVTLLIAAVIFAVSLGVQYPALMMYALAGSSLRDQPRIIALYSASFDIGMGLGAFILGAITDVADFSAAAWVAGTLCGVGLVIHLAVLPRVVR